METKTIKRSGTFSIEEVRVINQRCSFADPAESDSNGEKGRRFQWNWRFVEPGLVEVILAFHISPTEETPLEIEVAAVVRMILKDDFDSDSLRTLVQQTGPGIVIPFIREAIASMATRAGFPGVLLEPIPLGGLKDDLDVERTIGWEELQEDPSLSQRAGASSD